MGHPQLLSHGAPYGLSPALLLFQLIKSPGTKHCLVKKAITCALHVEKRRSGGIYGPADGRTRPLVEILGASKNKCASFDQHKSCERVISHENALTRILCSFGLVRRTLRFVLPTT